MSVVVVTHSMSPVIIYMCAFPVLILHSVVEVLEKHGLQKPIFYVKNSQNSEEEAHQLMVKLCRHTGRKYGLTSNPSGKKSSLKYTKC